MPNSKNYDLDIDTTLGGNNASDYVIPSQKAIKSYVDNHSGGGSSTDVQINGTSITSQGVADILTNSAYNASTNKIATMSDLPSTSGLANTDLSNLSNTGNAKFQAPLVSGANIKTINNTSLLGSGDISVGSYSAGTGLSLSGTTFNHSNSVTAGTAGTSSATSGSTLAVPYVTYDAQGHVTASGTHTHTVTGFQDTLVSGTNIKTINNESILGSGNITIGGGGTATDVQINGTSITSNGVANIVTNSAYNATSNKIATISDLSGKANDNAVVHLTGDETITGNKTIANGAILFTTSVGGSSYGSIGASATYGCQLTASNGKNLALGGKDLTYYSTDNSTNYTLLTGSTGLIPDERISANIQRASTAVTHTASTAVGDNNTPVYINSNGVATSTGKSIANTRFDGQWVYSNGSIFSVSSAATRTYDLSSDWVLPNDGYQYEVIGKVNTQYTNAIVRSQLSTSLGEFYYGYCPSGVNSLHDEVILIFPADSRILTAYLSAKAQLFSFVAYAYRRIGTNS